MLTILNKACSRLNKALEIIGDKCRSLAISLDGAKCKSMWFNTKKKNPPICPEIQLNGNTLTYTEKYKYLGLILDNRLKFDECILTKAKQSRIRLQLVLKMKGVVKRILRAWWIGFGLSFLTYGLPVIYHRLTKRNRTKLDKIVSSAARGISGLMQSTNADLALQESRLDSLNCVVGHARANLQRRMVGTRNSTKPRRENSGIFSAVENSPMMRSVEITFSRWRTGFIYNNEIKYKYGMVQDPMCRFCGKDMETRQHILLECSILEAHTRKYAKNIRKILGCEENEELSMEMCLNLDRTSPKGQIRKLAMALYRYTLDIDYRV